MFPEANFLVLPETCKGIACARRKIQEDSESKGDTHHWQIDDNIKKLSCTKFAGDKKIRISAKEIIEIVENYSFRYDNVALSGPNHEAFAFNYEEDITFNRIVSCFMLIRNDTGFYFRWGFDDQDFNMQVLMNSDDYYITKSRKWCTALFNRIMFEKIKTGVLRGGATDSEYVNNGRLKNAEALVARWPGCFRINMENAWYIQGLAWHNFTQQPHLIGAPEVAEPQMLLF